MAEDHHHHGHVPLSRSPNEWSMVAIRDNKDSSIFPPINHENLHLFSNHHHHIPPSQSPSPPSSSSSGSFSASDCDTDTWPHSPSSSSVPPFDSQVRKGADFTGWLSFGLQILRSKFLAFRNRNRHPQRGAIWSIGIPAVAVFIAMVVMMRRLKRKDRRGNLTPNETRLLDIIKEKDGRIAQLLHQIAQMNEILIDRHKALAAKVVQ